MKIIYNEQLKKSGISANQNKRLNCTAYII